MTLGALSLFSFSALLDSDHRPFASCTWVGFFDFGRRHSVDDANNGFHPRARQILLPKGTGSCQRINSKSAEVERESCIRYINSKERDLQSKIERRSREETSRQKGL